MFSLLSAARLAASPRHHAPKITNFAMGARRISTPVPEMLQQLLDDPSESSAVPNARSPTDDIGPPRGDWGSASPNPTVYNISATQRIFERPKFKLYFQTHTRNTVSTLVYVGPHDPKKKQEWELAEKRALEMGTLARVRKRDENADPHKHWGVAHFTGGSLGFKTSKRKTYEAGYQCAVKMLRVLEVYVGEGGIDLEIHLSGFGQGREGALAALLSTEGEVVRPHVRRLTDYTPLKVGGNRSKKMRRV